MQVRHASRATNASLPSTAIWPAPWAVPMPEAAALFLEKLPAASATYTAVKELGAVVCSAPGVAAGGLRLLRYGSVFGLEVLLHDSTEPAEAAAHPCLTLPCGCYRCLPCCTVARAQAGYGCCGTDHCTVQCWV